MTLPTVFISYSHDDEKEKNVLLAYLNVLRHRNLIDLWSDDDIQAGADVEQEIDKAIDRAKVAILLISVNFLNSDIFDQQVPELLKRCAQKELKVILVIAKHCPWNGYEWLKEIEVMPEGGRPIWSGANNYVDRDLTEIVYAVETRIKDHLIEKRKISGQISQPEQKVLDEINEDLNKITSGVFTPGRISKDYFERDTIVGDKYKILEWIGSGGYGDVYLAQAGDFGNVALKVLPPDVLSDSEKARRFAREARTIELLDHPNIIKVYETQQGEEHSYIAMEYIPGGSLRDRLEEIGPLPRSEAIHIIRGVGDALTYAHNHEDTIIHRDVKPENILLKTKDGSRQPVLTDFGLVKLLSANNVTPLTQTGAVLGTYLYMAPEQIDPGNSIAASDLYALAIIFFEMLAGRRPFEAATPMALMNKHLSEPLPQLSKFMPGFGDFFDDILSRATAKDPAGRYASVAEFVEALEAANEQAEQAERNRHRMEGHIARLLDSAQFYLQEKDYRRALNRVEDALELDPRHVNALRLMAEIHLKQEQFGDALDFYEQIYEQERRPSSEDGLNVLKLLRELGDREWDGGNYEKAGTFYERIIGILDEDDSGDARLQEIREQIKPRLIEFHMGEGDKAFVEGNPENLDEAIKILEPHIRWLDRLQAEQEYEELNRKQRSLQVKMYTNKIAAEERRLEEILSTAEVAFAEGEGVEDDNITQPYLDINGYYEKLMELDPDNYDWKENRKRKLKEQTERRIWLAGWAENRSDYEMAIRHYRSIRNIEQTYYPSLSSELNLNLSQKIDELEKKANYNRKYKEIRKLIINDKDLQKALEHLERDFIRKNEYEYLDVARMHWRLLVAKRHEWQISPEWVIALGEDPVEAWEIDYNREEKSGQLPFSLEPISIPIIASALVIGVVIGILIGIIVPWAQSLPGLVVVAVIAVLVWFGFQKWS